MISNVIRISCVISLLLGLWLGFGGKSIDSATTTSAVAETVAAPVTAPKYKTIAIRDIQPGGYKVLADNPQTPGQAAGDFGEFDPKSWQVHRFMMNKPNGGWLKIALARPRAWIESVERNDSGQVWLEFDELGIADWATLQATEPCPTDVVGDGRLVTGTFEHSSGEVLNLFIAGEATPIGSTANHPFWSEDRQDFVQAGSLEPGEHLRLADGRTTTLERAEPIAEQLPVYNLEVDGEHVYYVGESGVLVHNACPIVLGETMATRVSPVARQLGAHTFAPRSLNPVRWMANQKRWIADQIKSGRKIFDIGTDASRPSRSSYYSAEVQALKDAGYIREFRRWISAEVNGETRRFRLYEWVHP